MNTRKLAITAAAFCTAVIAQSCGSSDANGPKGAGIRIVSDIARSDTIDALSGQMVLSISDSTGGLRHPAAVFISANPASGGHGMIPIDVVGDGSFPLSSTGELKLRVQFGTQAGPESITITVPELELSTTLWFTVKPGAPAYLTLHPGDTTVVPNESYTQTGVIVDRGGNDLNLASHLMVSTDNTALALGPGGKVTGLAYGRASISVGFDAVRETAMASVVPLARLAGVSYSGDITVMSTDGSGLKRFPVGCLYWYGVSWTPDGSRVVFTANSTNPGSPPIARIYSLLPATGAVTPIISDTVSALRDVPLADASVSHDGKWVYFIAQLGTGDAIWRAHPDGSGAEQLLGVPATMPFLPRRFPSLSADGAYLAYVSNGDVKIMNTVDGSTTSLSGLGATMARWSPIANELAVRGDTRGVYTVNADGSGLRSVATDLASSATLDWSPDAHWLVASLPNPTLATRAAIIEVQSGMQLPMQLAIGEIVAWSPK